VIGPLVGGIHAARAVRATLLRWLPSVLLEVQADWRADTLLDAAELSLPLPDVVGMPIGVAALNAVATPALAVASSGLAGKPVRDGRGRYSVPYGVTVRVLDRAGGYDATAMAVHAYSVAVRTALMQHRSLGGVATTLEWAGEDYAVIDTDAARTLAGVDVGFIAHLPHVLDDRAGPTEPPTPAGITPDRPIVQTVDPAAIQERPRP
jgi:hypothetical protein